MEQKPKGKSWISNLLFEDEGRASESPAESSDTFEPELPVSEPVIAPVAARPEAIGGGKASDGALLNLKEIYRSAGIAENPFATPEQVMELQATFSDLPVEMQKQKVLKTLGSFKVDVQAIVDNTRAKTSALGSYLQGIQTDAQNTIEASNQTIAQLQEQIDACRSRITEAQSLLDQTQAHCGREISRLKEVLDFLGATASLDAPPDRRIK